MSQRRYTKVQMLLPQIKSMLSDGKSHKEIEAHFGLQGDRPVHNLLKREGRKQRRIEAGIELRPKGRPARGNKTPEAEKDYEIKRLRMENELLRDFLHVAGGK